MTERGLPIVDGAPACPFVAFEDDRDARATSPDYRHRCYAEPQPAPRALAHQEAYCLSSAFPVCPTFQDWARREAAHARTDEPRPEPAGASGNDASQRNPPRSWQAPPPWLSGRGGAAAGAAAAGAARGGAAGAWLEDEESEEEGFDDVPPVGRGLSGSYADRVASDGDVAAGGAVGAYDAGNGHERPEPSRQAPDRSDDEPSDGDAAEPAPSRRRVRDPSRVAAFAGGAAPSGGSPPNDRRSPERRRETAPEWERAKPFEAYPTLRSRRLPELSVPPILVAVVAVALAAAVLFALPGLLGFGNPSSVATPTPGAAQQSAGPSIAPTAAPAATSQIYVVQAGDTLFRIAGRFGISAEDLIAANAGSIPNPDSLQIGQEINIPVPVPSELPAASVIPAAS